MKYILNWNDEYLDMQIVSGPFDEETAKQALKDGEGSFPSLS